MTELTEVFGGTVPEGDVAAVAQLAAAAVAPNLVKVTDLPLLAVREQSERGGDAVRLIDMEPFMAAPERRRGTVVLHEAQSFVDYVNTQKVEASRIYASRAKGLVVAVLNDDPAVAAAGGAYGGWRDQCASLVLERTPEWQRWLELDKKLVTQVEFAEHLEECRPDIVEPAAADLVEIARSFTASTTISFRSAHKLVSGETQIAYDETVNATAGEKKNVTIPSEFKLRIAPYHGIEPIEIVARLRYRLGSGGTLGIGYMLDKPVDVELKAFGDVVEVVRTGTELLTMMGEPAGSRSPAEHWRS